MTQTLTTIGHRTAFNNEQKDTRNTSESTRSYLTASSKSLTTNKKNHASETKLSIRTHPTSNGFSVKTS